MNLRSKKFKWPAIAVIFVLAFAVMSPVMARETPANILASHIHVLKSKKGGEIPFLLEETTNAFGQKEIAVYDEVIDKVTVKGESIIMVGRDLDGDGFYDAWFVLGHGGVVKAIDLPAKRSDGWDAVSRILRDNSDLFKERDLALIWFEWLSRWSAGKKKLLEMESTQINLHSLEIETDRMAALDPGNEIVRANYARLGEAWNALAEKADEHFWNAINGLMIDEALTVSGYMVVKWAAPVLNRIGIAVADSRAAEFVSGLRQKYAVGFQRAIKATLLRIQGKMPAVPGSLAARTGALVQPIRLTTRNISKMSRHMVEVMEQHDKLSRTLVHLFRHAIEVGRMGVAKKNYVAGVTGIQLGVEVLQRRKVLFDLDPIMLPERVQNWKELALNVGYMTTETFVGSGVARLASSPYKSMGICAILSTVDSMFWTKVVKGDADAVRIGLDTGWEVTIGNFQTTVIDPAGFGLAQVLATKFNNQKFQIVGWAIAVADQAAGYFGYNAVTEKAYPRIKKAYDARKSRKTSGQELPPVRFIPIVAPNY